MKAIFSILLFATLLFVSCKKEHTECVEDADTTCHFVDHYCYLNGTITDSLTNNPLSGYIIKSSVGTDTIDSDGTYLLKYEWLTSPTHPTDSTKTVGLSLFNSSGVHVKNIFQDTILIDNDTITVDFVI